MTFRKSKLIYNRPQKSGWPPLNFRRKFRNRMLLSQKIRVISAIRSLNVLRKRRPAEMKNRFLLLWEIIVVCVSNLVLRGIRLELENSELVFNSNHWNCNESLSRFLHIFNRVSNKHAPLKILNIRNKSSKPWITSGLKASMKTREKFYKKWLLTHDLTWYNKYKLYRNK